VEINILVIVRRYLDFDRGSRAGVLGRQTREQRRRAGAMPARRRRAPRTVRMPLAIFASKADAAAEANEPACRMRLDPDGILEVTAVEKRMGRPNKFTIATLSPLRALRRARPAGSGFRSSISTRGEVEAAIGGDCRRQRQLADIGGDGREESAPDADRERRSTFTRAEGRLG